MEGTTIYCTAERGLGATAPEGVRLAAAILAAILGAILVCCAPGIPADAQTTDIELLSKSDALQMFAMSRQQWDRNVTVLVARGTATRTYPAASGLVGMLMTTPYGTVITRLDYSKGDAKPAFVQMAVTFPLGWEPLFTDAAAQETIINIQTQLAPEFEVDGHMERLRDGPAFFFIITERRPRGGTEAAQKSP